MHSARRTWASTAPATSAPARAGTASTPRTSATSATIPRYSIEAWPRQERMPAACARSCYGSRPLRDESRALQIPVFAVEVAEDDEIAAVGGHHLPVAAAQRPVGPPAVPDEPRLAHRLDDAPVDPERHPARVRAHARATGLVQAARPAHSNGVSTARRSGTRESGSTANTRSAASGPAA